MRWLAAAAFLAAVGRASSPPLSISLETSWEAPPFILEILETVYDEEPSAYFPLLHLLSTHLPTWRDTSDEGCLTSSLDLIESHRLLPTPGALSTLQYALGLHTAAPRIEALYRFYDHSVDENALGVGECAAWVEWKGKGFCSADELKRDMELSIEDGLHHSTPIQHLLPLDHVSPSSEPNSKPHAILYYNPASAASGQLLSYLEQQASRIADFQYVVRYRPISQTVNGPGRKVGMSGYGVEMALKKTDYLVVDDRATGSSSASGKTASSGQSKDGDSRDPLRGVLGDDPWAELATPLTASEMNNISLSAASLVMDSPRPLDALLRISQDFPKYTAALARRVHIPDRIQRAAARMAKRGEVSPGLYINGKGYTGSEVNAYSLLKIARSERNLMLGLTSLGLTPRQAFELLSDPMIGQTQAEDSAGEGVVDASDRLEEGQVITWWNDIEKDKRYKTWPTSLQTLLRPVYPGQLHTIRKNIWNVVFVLDFSLAPSLETMSTSIATMIQRGVPLHFGVVPMLSASNDDLSVQMAKIVKYSIETFGRGLTRELLGDVVAATPSSPTSPGKISLASVRTAYDEAASQSTKDSISFDDLLALPLDEDWARLTQVYCERLLATPEESAQGHMFINGRHSYFGGAWTSVVQQELATQLGFLQEWIATATGSLPDDVSTFFYDIPGVPTRRSKLVIPPSGEQLKGYNVLDVFAGDPTGKLRTELVHTDDASRGAPISIWIVGDLDSQEGLAMAENALLHLQEENCGSRVGFVHVPSTSQPAQVQRFSTVLYHLVSTSTLSKIRAGDLLSLLREVKASQSKGYVELGGDESPQAIFDGGPLHALTGGGWDVIDVAAAGKFWDAGRGIAKKLGIRDEKPYILVNGRLVGPVSTKAFPLADFDMLEEYELRKRVKPVIDALRTMYEDITKFDRATLANLITTASSIVTAAYRPSETEGLFTPLSNPRGRFYEQLDEGDLSFHIGDKENALLHVAAVFDPISESAQRWTPLLQTLSEMEHVSVSVFLEPDPEVLEIKLKRFYRTALTSRPHFDVDGNSVAPGVTFLDLPGSPIYTLGLDTPQAWIVSPTNSPYDLDNLQLSSIHEPVNVLFTLKQLLVEGHAREGLNVPPRGLQLQLTSRGMEVASDTLVMANLGYLQFKVTPGVYDLHIRPGRGQEVYSLESVGTEGWDSPPVNQSGPSVALTSFDGVTILPRFERKAGMERADVLQESTLEQPKSYIDAVFSRVKSIIGLTPAPPPKVQQADINIFTVASGLLYERFASIMILSVLKHTNHTVKFWFIENFLSPSFIKFVPQMAQEYGFEYEFVTYKFPPWLRAQTEKQRIIWAYKILFLDVLFPLDLDKVIFVDADQIVRTDMKELVDLDLQGHVYGMTPMGDSRTEMEGFRFWKTGYWKEALRGRPYHISALYVVDLKRFRQLATGDRLRGQYHALSADPNSLANLDQDLPNSMQDIIPIFTLPQDWLWCQTWCSDESLATAKTIDLCQNPLTKEPKLVRARQIPEWDTYDQEIAAFAARISDSGALGASVEALASNQAGGAAVVEVEEVEDVDEEVIEPAAGSEADQGREGHHIEGEL